MEHQKMPLICKCGLLKKNIMNQFPISRFYNPNHNPSKFHRIEDGFQSQSFRIHLHIDTNETHHYYGNLC